MDTQLEVTAEKKHLDESETDTDAKVGKERPEELVTTTSKTENEHSFDDVPPADNSLHAGVKRTRPEGAIKKDYHGEIETDPVEKLGKEHQEDMVTTGSKADASADSPMEGNQQKEQ